MKTPAAPVAIPAPTKNDKPFPIRHEHTIYEAAMVYAGRHPYPFDLGPYDTRDRRERCLTLLKLGLKETPQKRPRAQRSWDIFCELGERIKRSQITPITIARDLAGEIDLIDTVISIADLVQVAIDRRERPKYLRRFPTKTAAPDSIRKMTKREAVANFVKEKYPNGIAGVTYGEIAREYKRIRGKSVDPRTVARALGHK
jgi:hypothetical protein